jgi:phosphatidylglycerophosphate synthase
MRAFGGFSLYEGFRWLLSPLVKAFVRLQVPPALISAAGILFTGVAFILMYRGYESGAIGWMRAAGGVILFAAAWDTVDGEVARALGKTSPKGAFLDSVLDRVSEFIIFLGIFLFFGFGKLDCALLFALLFVSYSELGDTRSSFRHRIHGCEAVYLCSHKKSQGLSAHFW